MRCWPDVVDACELPPVAARELEEAGFTVIPGPVPAADLPRLIAAHDAAVACAAPEDIKVGSTTTRVRDFVNRGAEFDRLYLHPPVLQSCSRILNAPFRLSTMHARTVRPGLPAQGLHVDFPRDHHGWTMIGFIFMVDELRADNGATRFIPGSHLWDSFEEGHAEQLACGPPGSMVIFNGSVWHGHSTNRSTGPRRSIQGAYIRRDQQSGEDLPARMLPETLSRISPLARYLLAVEPPQPPAPRHDTL